MKAIKPNYLKSLAVFLGCLLGASTVKAASQNIDTADNRIKNFYWLIPKC